MHSSGWVCAHFICFVASTCCSHRRKTRLCSPQKHQSTCSHPLEREDSELIIDGAVGNLVWKHVGLDSLKVHPGWKTFLDYFWCIIGALLEEKPFIEYHMWWPPLKYPPSSHGIRAVGNHWKNTYHGSNCTSMEGFKTRYPLCVWKGFIFDMDNLCLRGTDINTLCDQVHSNQFITDDSQTRQIAHDILTS